MRPVKASTTEGVSTIRSPHRAVVALAGSCVVLIAVTAFNLGLDAEWKRPQPQLGSPLVAVQAVALRDDELPALLHSAPEEEESEVAPVRRAAVTLPSAPQAAPVAKAASVSTPPAAPMVRDAVLTEQPANDPVGDILAAPY